MPKDIAATYNAHTYDAEWLGKLDRHLEGLAGSHTHNNEDVWKLNGLLTTRAASLRAGMR